MSDEMVKGGKRLAIIQEGMDGWWVSYSPRNSNNNAEGQWCQWVHLATLEMDRCRVGYRIIVSGNQNPRYGWK